MLEALRNMRYVTENTLIVVEASLDTHMDYARELGFSVVREKLYKTNKHIFIRKEVSSI